MEGGINSIVLVMRLLGELLGELPGLSGGATWFVMMLHELRMCVLAYARLYVCSMLSAKNTMQWDPEVCAKIYALQKPHSVYTNDTCTQFHSFFVTM